MRKGRVFKRCGTCLRQVADRACDNCGERNWSWYFVVDVNPPGRKRKQRKEGGFRTEKEARAAMNELQAKALSGSLVDPDKITVGQYLRDKWVPVMRQEVKAGTAELYSMYVDRYIAPETPEELGEGYRHRLTDIPLQGLTRADVKALYAELTEHGRVRGKGGLSPKTVHNIHLCLHRALADAVDDRLIPFNPADGAHKTPRTTQPDDLPAWNEAELELFLSQARGERLYGLFHLAAYTGARRGELIALRWRDIDLERGLVTITRQLAKGEGGAVELGTPKSARGNRTLDLDAGTVQMLRDHRANQTVVSFDGNDLLFAAEGGQPLHPDVASQTFDRIVSEIDVPRITFHGLRHTHATIMLRAGVPLHVVSRRLGHASESFTASRYAHVLPGQQAEAASAFAAAVARRDDDSSAEA